ncbi:titin-like [Toxorhynchites rutilus septentrionalis]|uniref:titin-like n=1 Tax=Toxorhynchites rutilus septentrionalis TaxID=329112 RepID=UPI00247AA124|nr:titin-like [Toxorhynchites rutilus septentrionalis]
MKIFIVLSVGLAVAIGAAIEKPQREVDVGADQDSKVVQKRGLSDYASGYEYHPEFLSGFKPSFAYDASWNVDNSDYLEHTLHDWKSDKHTVEKHTIIEKRVPVHIDRPVPYRVEVERKVPVYIEKKVPVHVDRPVPYPVKVPYPVEVERKVPVYVEKKVHIDRPVPYRVEVEKKVPVVVEKKVHVHVDRYVPVPVEVKVPVVHKVEVEVPKPYTVQIPKPFPVYIEKEVIKHVDRPVPVEVVKKVPVPVVHKVEVPKPYVVYVENGKHHDHHEQYKSTESAHNDNDEIQHQHNAQHLVQLQKENEYEQHQGVEHADDHCDDHHHEEQHHHIPSHHKRESEPTEV